MAKRQQRRRNEKSGINTSISKTSPDRTVTSNPNAISTFFSKLSSVLPSQGQVPVDLLTVDEDCQYTTDMSVVETNLEVESEKINSLIIDNNTQRPLDIVTDTETKDEENLSETTFSNVNKTLEDDSIQVIENSSEYNFDHLPALDELKSIGNTLYDSSIQAIHELFTDDKPNSHDELNRQSDLDIMTNSLQNKHTKSEELVMENYKQVNTNNTNELDTEHRQAAFNSQNVTNESSAYIYSDEYNSLGHLSDSSKDLNQSDEYNSLGHLSDSSKDLNQSDEYNSLVKSIEQHATHRLNDDNEYSSRNITKYTKNLIHHKNTNKNFTDITPSNIDINTNITNHETIKSRYLYDTYVSNKTDENQVGQTKNRVEKSQVEKNSKYNNVSSDNHIEKFNDTELNNSVKADIIQNENKQEDLTTTIKPSEDINVDEVNQQNLNIEIVDSILKDMTNKLPIMSCQSDLKTRHDFITENNPIAESVTNIPDINNVDNLNNSSHLTIVDIHSMKRPPPETTSPEEVIRKPLNENESTFYNNRVDFHTNSTTENWKKSYSLIKDQPESKDFIYNIVNLKKTVTSPKELDKTAKQSLKSNLDSEYNNSDSDTVDDISNCFLSKNDIDNIQDQNIISENNCFNDSSQNTKSKSNVKESIHTLDQATNLFQELTTTKKSSLESMLIKNSDISRFSSKKVSGHKYSIPVETIRRKKSTSLNTAKPNFAKVENVQLQASDITKEKTFTADWEPTTLKDKIFNPKGSFYKICLIITITQIIIGSYFLDTLVSAYKKYIVDTMSITHVEFGLLFSLPSLGGLFAWLFSTAVSTGVCRLHSVILYSQLGIMLFAICQVHSIIMRNYNYLLIWRVCYWSCTYIALNSQTITVYRLAPESRRLSTLVLGLLITSCRIGGVVGYFASGSFAVYFHGDVTRVLKLALLVNVYSFLSSLAFTYLFHYNPTLEKAGVSFKLVVDKKYLGESFKTRIAAWVHYSLQAGKLFRYVNFYTRILLFVLSTCFAVIFSFETDGVYMMETTFKVSTKHAGMLIAICPFIAQFSPLLSLIKNQHVRHELQTGAFGVFLMPLGFLTILFPGFYLIISMILIGISYGVSSTVLYCVLPVLSTWSNDEGPPRPDILKSLVKNDDLITGDLELEEYIINDATSLPNLERNQAPDTRDTVSEGGYPDVNTLQISILTKKQSDTCDNDCELSVVALTAGYLQVFMSLNIAFCNFVVGSIRDAQLGSEVVILFFFTYSLLAFISLQYLRHKSRPAWKRYKQYVLQQEQSNKISMQVEN